MNDTNGCAAVLTRLDIWSAGVLVMLLKERPYVTHANKHVITEGDGDMRVGELRVGMIPSWVSLWGCKVLMGQESEVEDNVEDKGQPTISEGSRLFGTGPLQPLSPHSTST